jgi:hypothetical protein
MLIHTLICGSHDGPYFRDCYSRFHEGGWSHTFTSHIEEMRTKVVAAVGMAPTVISVHFGVWDLASKWQNGSFAQEVWFEGYPDDWVATASRALRRIESSFPRSVLIFRIIGPTVHHRFKDSLTQQRLDMRFVQSMAAASRAMCKRDGFNCIDFFSMMLGIDSATTDGLHWDGDIMASSYFNTLLHSVCS